MAMNRQAQKKWDAENTKVIHIKLMKSKDADVIEFYSSLKNKAEWFRSVCRREMERL